ncbi:MAG TPA: hypothetical protein VD833_07335 [Vicinamibacterales bacterium]|nr:hypothetical protein [Vicinamibacterales bacterium]
MAAVFFYISGHGFGHASRQIAIVNALGARAPEVEIVIRSSVPLTVFGRTLRVPARVEPGDCDTGVVQFDSLRLDEAETICRADAFHAELPARAAREAALLRRHEARLVISDAPPLACEAAWAAGVPSVVVSNFTWDWIYEGYPAELGSAPELIPHIRQAYGRAGGAWRLPMHGGFAAFEAERIIDVPFVARHARHDRATVRRTLGLPADRPIVLFSFGGFAVRDLDFDHLDCLPAYDVLLTSHEAAGVAALDRPGVHVVPEQRIYESGFQYEDLVAAADVVLTKPGYGIISECVANGPAILYTSRGRFREYEVLVDAMPALLRCGYIDQIELFQGRWRAPLDAVLARREPTAKPATDGAARIAGMILEHLER